MLVLSNIASCTETIKTFQRYRHTKWQIPLPYGSNLHEPSTNYHHVAAQQVMGTKTEEREKKKNLNEKCWRLFWKKSGKWTISRKMARQKSKTNRKTREKIGKGNQMTALKFKTWENIRHHGLPSGARQGRTSDIPSVLSVARKIIRHPGLPSGARQGRTSDILASLQGPDREDQTSWPPFRGQTGKNIRHPGLLSGARQGRTSDILASFQGPDRDEHQTSWPPFRGQRGKNISHPGLHSGARQGRTSDILASLQRPERE